MRNIIKASTAMFVVMTMAEMAPAMAQSTAPAPGASAQPGTAEQAPTDIVVTGSRKGYAASASAAPIEVLNQEALTHVGQPALAQALTQLVPSFNVSTFGGDTGALTVSAQLRGLSPNQTLILVNGKRRHGTANLSVLSGPTQGGDAPDLDFIAPAAIKRIEVLEDGAAAQYGSDAIAGVINIILKDASTGGSFSATGGQYYKSDGETASAAANAGMKIGEGGFLNVTGMYRYHNFSRTGGVDRRLSYPNGTLRTDLSAAQAALYAAVPGYPYENKLFGDPKTQLYQGSYDAGYDFGSVQAYSFGTLSYRTALANESYRVPDRIIASPTLGVAGTLTTPGELIFAPAGFTPQDAMHEMDYSVTGGLKGDMSGLKWDLSATYGRDRGKVYNENSANASLFVNTHTTPTTFYIGDFISDELTTDADFVKDWDIGFATPLTLAFGGEYRRDSYSEGQGDAASTYAEGSQALPGHTAVDASSHARSNVSAYVDLSAKPIEKLKLDAAGRYEHYTDFGSAVSGKLTARYDFSRWIAIRGTVANGFRAPSLAEQYYSSTNVGPTYAVVQLPPNSAAAKLIGFQNLKAEKAFNVSGGVVFNPVNRLTITADYYHISIRDRILASGAIYGRGGASNNPAVLAAIAAQGTTIDPTVPQVSVSSFMNGGNTMTNGVDVVANYLVQSSFGNLNLALSGNYNNNKVTKITNSALLDQTAISFLQTGSPRFKIINGLSWELNKFSIVARGTLFGRQSVYYSPNGGSYYKNEIPTSYIVDLELGYDIRKDIKFSIGANNLLDKRPPNIVNVPGPGPVFTTSPGYSVYNAPMTFSAYGINGGYYYARVDVKF